MKFTPVNYEISVYALFKSWAKQSNLSSITPIVAVPLMFISIISKSVSCDGVFL